MVCRSPACGASRARTDIACQQKALISVSECSDMGLKRREVLAGLGSSSLLVGAGCVGGGESADGDAGTDCTGTIETARASVSYRCGAGPRTSYDISGTSENCEELELRPPENLVSVSVGGPDPSNWAFAGAGHDGFGGSPVQLVDGEGNVLDEKPIEYDRPQTLYIHESSIETERVAVGESVTVTFSLRSDVNMSVTAQLVVDDNAVASTEQSVDGNDMGGPDCGSKVNPEQEISHRFTDAGEYDLTLSVEGDGTGDATDSKHFGTVTVEA